MKGNANGKKSCHFGKCIKGGKRNFLFPDLKEQIVGKDVPSVMLGDPAYYLL